MRCFVFSYESFLSLPVLFFCSACGLFGMATTTQESPQVAMVKIAESAGIEALPQSAAEVFPEAHAGLRVRYPDGVGYTLGDVYDLFYDVYPQALPTGSG